MDLFSCYIDVQLYMSEIKIIKKLMMMFIANSIRDIFLLSFSFSNFKDAHALAVENEKAKATKGTNTKPSISKKR